MADSLREPFNLRCRISQELLPVGAGWISFRRSPRPEVREIDRHQTDLADRVRFARLGLLQSARQFEQLHRGGTGTGQEWIVDESRV